MLSLMVYFDIFLSLNQSGMSASNAPARYHRTVLLLHTLFPPHRPISVVDLLTYG